MMPNSFLSEESFVEPEKAAGGGGVWNIYVDSRKTREFYLKTQTSDLSFGETALFLM